MARKYTVYWYRKGRKNEYSGQKTIMASSLERASVLAKAEGDHNNADGVALYDARDVLVGDWSFIDHTWHSNLKKKKSGSEPWHPFGL